MATKKTTTTKKTPAKGPAKAQTPKPVDMSFDDLKRFLYSETPREVLGQWNAQTLYWKNYLLRMIFGAFDFNNIPEGWEKDYMLEHLFLDGMFAITDTELGVLPLACGVFGVNVFNHPTSVNIANPVLGNLTRTIDKDCALVKLEYTYHGIHALLNRFADLLAQCDKSVSVNLMNSTATVIMFADDKAQAETMKNMYDEISLGKPAVFVKRSQVQKSDIYFNNVKNNFIADDIQIVQRKIIDQFLTTVGINNANTDKRERMIRAEAESNDTEVQASVEHWLETVNHGIDTANKLYGLNIEFVRKRFEAETMMELEDDIEHAESGDKNETGRDT